MNTHKTKYTLIAILLFLSVPIITLSQIPEPIPPCQQGPCQGDSTAWQTTDLVVGVMPGVPWNCTFHVAYTWRKCGDRVEINGFNFTFDSFDPNCTALYDSIYNNPTNRANFLRNFYMAMPGAIARQLAINSHNDPWRTPGDGDCPDSKKYYDFNIGACMSFYGYRSGTIIPIIWVQPYNCSNICCKWSYEICYNTVTHQYDITESRHMSESQVDCNATGTELPGSPYEIFRIPCMPICDDGHGD